MARSHWALLTCLRWAVFAERTLRAFALRVSLRQQGRRFRAALIPSAEALGYFLAPVPGFPTEEFNRAKPLHNLPQSGFRG